MTLDRVGFPVPFAAVLGPDEGRYFAAGYRDVGYSIDQIRLGDGGVVEADASVSYAPTWSLDSTGAPRVPHLSTIDALVLSVLLAEQVLIGADAAPTARVVSFSARAGRCPWERLDRVPITCVVLGDPAAGTLRVSGTVGNIRSTVVIASDPAVRPLPQRSAAALMGPYGSPGGIGTVLSDLTEFDDQERVLSGSHRLDPPPVAAVAAPSGTLTPPSGIESAFWPSPTAVDHFALMGQLSQALIFLALDTDRSRMGDLWMRTASLDLTAAQVPAADSWESRTTLLRQRTIRRSSTIHDLSVESRTSSGVVGAATLAYTEAEHQG